MSDSREANHDTTPLVTQAIRLFASNFKSSIIATGSLREISALRDMKKRAPEFRSEDKERAFWATHDSTDYIDWSQARQRKLANLKPSLRDVPYQSLLKVFLAERLEQERRRPSIGLTVPQFNRFF